MTVHGANFFKRTRFAFILQEKAFGLMDFKEFKGANFQAIQSNASN